MTFNGRWRGEKLHDLRMGHLKHERPAGCDVCGFPIPHFMPDDMDALTPEAYEGRVDR
jgi:hypothetical protein